MAVTKSQQMLLICIFLIIIPLIIFWDVQNFDFVNFDDPVYILDNPHIRSGLSLENISWAFTTLHAGFWFPVTWLSHMLDCELYGLNPGGHHFNNLILHILNTVLLFQVLFKMTGKPWRSAFVSLLFAIHPLHVEAVAWVSARKDLLCTFFWMLSMLSYFYYVNNPNLTRYLLVILIFIFGLMSKPMIITLPFILILIDYWPLNRFNWKSSSLFSRFFPSWPQSLDNRRMFFIFALEKAPLIFCSVLSALLVYFAEKQYGAVRTLDSFPLDIRLANAITSFGTYVLKFIWPQNLSFFYPHEGMPPLWKIIGSGFILISITILCIKYARLHPYLLSGWMFYIITLFPVIGIVQIGVHSMADRYTYIPFTGLFIIIAWGVPDLIKKIGFPYQVLIASGGLVCLAFTAVTLFQIPQWRNSIRLFSHALEVTSNNYFANNNLGIEYFKNGDLDKAMEYFSEALKIRPLNLETNTNMGAVLARKGRLDEAIKHFLWVQRRDPNSAGANFNLGIALSQQGRYDEAIDYLSKALDIKPDYPEAHFNLGIIFFNQKKYHKARLHFLKALQLRPGYLEAGQYLRLTIQKIYGS